MLAPAVNWYSDLYSCLEMHTTVAAIEQGEDVSNKSECYENRAVMAMLRQALGRGGEIGSSVWWTSSFNHDTKQW
eukprot:884510-Ditylum_brightwellii.AAC.1